MLRTYARQSLLIWFFTNLKGSVILWIILPKGIAFYHVLLASLVLSIPAATLLLPALYILDFIVEPTKRIFFSVISSLSICAVVLMIFLGLVSDITDTAGGVGQMLLPYVVAAPICFIIVVEISVVRKLKS